MFDRPSIVVTGTGLVLPLGTDVATVWQRVLAGDSAIGALGRFPVGADQPGSSGEVADEHTRARLRIPKNAKFMTRQVACAVRAGKEAIASSGLDLTSLDPFRVSIYAGSGETGLEGAEFFKGLELAWGDRADQDYRFLGGPPSRAVAPFWLLRTLSNAGIALLATELQAQGPGGNFVHGETAAAMAIAAGCDDLTAGRCDVALVGGYDSLVAVSTYLAYEHAGLLSKATPDRAYRPFDLDRDGLVLGEGAAFLVLERLEDAARRGASILGEVCGVGSATEPEDWTDLAASPGTVAAAVEAALAGSAPDLVIARGIGTPAGDRAEAATLASIAECAVPVSAFKSHTGYLGAATAAVETVFALLALRDRLAPPIARHDQRDPHIPLDLVIGQPRPLLSQCPTAVWLGSGWTGTCAAVAVRRFDPADRPA